MTIPGDPRVDAGVGRRFGLKPDGTSDAPVEAFVDAAVVSWYPPYAAEVAAICETLRREAIAEFGAATAALIAADPGSRDTVSPAPWRTGLRVAGFLAAAATLAGFVVALGFGRRNQPPIDASTVAVLVGIASVLALGCFGSSLLFPSRMGTPNRMTSSGLWIAALGTLGSAGASTLRQDTWDASTPVWWGLSVVVGVALFLLAFVVAFARRRHAHMTASVGDDDVIELRVSALTAALDRSQTAMMSAWRQLDAETREALERERDDAIGALQIRNRDRIDGEWLRSTAPGMLGLPHAADVVHRGMHSGSAQLVDRREPGRYGYFVKRSRRQRSVDDASRSDG